MALVSIAPATTWQRDDNGWYRVIYTKKIAGRRFMLHSFIKKSAKTNQRDLDVGLFRRNVITVADDKG